MANCSRSRSTSARTLAPSPTSPWLPAPRRRPRYGQRDESWEKNREKSCKKNQKTRGVKRGREPALYQIVKIVLRKRVSTGKEKEKKGLLIRAREEMCWGTRVNRQKILQKDRCTEIKKSKFGHARVCSPQRADYKQTDNGSVISGKHLMYT